MYSCNAHTLVVDDARCCNKYNGLKFLISSRLRPVDVEFLSGMCKLVNIIPVIAKVDTLTTQECKKLKLKILEDCQKHKITIFDPALFDLSDTVRSCTVRNI